MMLEMRALLLGSLLLLGGCGSPALAKGPLAGGAKPTAQRALTPDARLERGLTRLGQSRYADAEADLLAALAGSKRVAAELALSELMLTTGRFPEAIARAKQALAAGADAQL